MICSSKFVDYKMYHLGKNYISKIQKILILKIFGGSFLLSFFNDKCY